MKKWSILLVIAILLTAFCGCGKEHPIPSAGDKDSSAPIGSTTEDAAATTTVSDTSTTDTELPETEDTSTDSTTDHTIDTTDTTTNTAAKTTAKTTVKTTQKTASVATLINNAKLTPMKTNAPSLDALVDSVFAKIHTSGMTTYDKVKACFDYLVNECEYDYAFAFLPDDLIYESYYDGTLVENAYAILYTKGGVCDNYSAAFAVMCRRIGLDAHVEGGSISKKGGGRTGHAWAYIRLNGVDYIFDPQVQSNNKNAPYYFFGKTYKEMGTTYEIEAGYYDASSFNKFACYARPASDMEMIVRVVGTETDTFDAQQEGYSSKSVDVSGLCDDGITVKENGCVDLVIKPTGGSGKYYLGVVMVIGEKETVLSDQTVTGQSTVTIDYSPYSNQQAILCVVLLDKLNPESRLTMEDIRLRMPDNK